MSSLKCKCLYSFAVVLSAGAVLLAALSGCAAKNVDIAILDTYFIQPRMYDTKFSDGDNTQNGTDEDNGHASDDRYSAIYRSRSEFIDFCEKAGREPGDGIPDYSDEWFKTNSLLVLAFTDSRSYPTETFSVNSVKLNDRTVTVDLQYDGFVEMFIDFGRHDCVLIEVEAKSVKKVKTVEFNKPSSAFGRK